MKERSGKTIRKYHRGLLTLEHNLRRYISNFTIEILMYCRNKTPKLTGRLRVKYINGYWDIFLLGFEEKSSHPGYRVISREMGRKPFPSVYSVEK